MADTFFSISEDVTLSETNVQTFPFPEVQITVTRSGDLSGENEIIYESVSDTATSGRDYFGTTFVRLRFAPGETSKTIILNLFGDTQFEGDEVFFGRLRDATNGAVITRDTATVTILNDDPNQSPSAGNDTATTDEETAIATINVLGNDTDPDEQPLRIIDIDTSDTKGIVTQNDDGTFSYDPNGQFVSLNDGETAFDEFIYAIDDGFGGTDTATVTVEITGITNNGAPTAGDDSGTGFTTNEDTAFTTASVLSNDSDPDGELLTITDVDDRFTRGQVTDNGDGTFDYDPNGRFEYLTAGQTRTDRFSYTVDDGNGNQDTATVEITVEGADDFDVYFSGIRDETVGDLTFDAQDIVVFDGEDFELAFDGSDVMSGRTGINAFDVISDTEILMTFAKPIVLEGLGRVDDSDVVKFIADAPSALGETTSGRFEMYLDGSDVQLNGKTERIDALSQLDNGDLLLSTTGNARLNGGLRVSAQDVVRFSPNSLGANTSGSFSLEFDGSDVQLSKKSEALDAIAFQDSQLLFSTAGNWSAQSESGRREDIGSFTGSLGSRTSGSFADNLFFDASQFGFRGNLTGLDVEPSVVERVSRS